jgi:retinol dehydrogenase 12
MEKKRIVITGATGAVGKATALELAAQGHELILVGRNAQKLGAVKAEIGVRTGHTDVAIVVADLAEPASIRQAISQLQGKYSSIDALVNVAAIYKGTRAENSQGLELMFATNHLGPFLLTQGLLDLLAASGAGRVVTVSAPSTTKLNFEDLQGKTKFSALNAFGASKMMNLLTTYALARRLAGKKVTTTVLHPGLVKSELTNEMPGALKFLLSLLSSKPTKAAKMLAKLAVDPQYATANGKFFKFNGKEIKSHAYSYDEAVQERLWKETERWGIDD